MKLERITLENFRQYYGPQHLDFSKEKQRKVTVIHGVNGAGKTSLFLAINWCLYGNDVAENVGELISKEAISKAEFSEYVNMSVELTFLHDGERYMVSRTRKSRKMMDGSASSDVSEDFTVMRMHGDGQTERIKNPIGTINAILPSNVRTYFLFDGEKIDDFAKPESAKQVREAISLVFKLETLDRAQRHLEAVAGDYRKELKNTSSRELRNIIERDDKARAELEKNEQGKAEVTTEIEIVRHKIADIDQQLRGTQDAKALQQQRDRIERELRQRRTELDEIVNQLRDLATGAFFVLAESAVHKALEILDTKREKGEIPSNIRQQLVQDLLTQMRCICGRPFNDGSPEHQRLLSLLQSSIPDSLSDDVLEISAILRTFEERRVKQRANISQNMRQRATLKELIEDLTAEADDVGRQLKNSPLEEISLLEQRRQEFRADTDRYNMELGKLNARIEQLNKDIAQLEKDIAKAKKNEQREKLLGAKHSLAQAAADAIKERYQIYADDMRRKIEAKTKEVFKQLIWKDSYFRDVQLDENFNLEVIDQYGRPARPELSAGERQVLSLSFITAMARISEEEAPLVMDTPFGRLSSQPRSNITEHLPELADQLVLLVTDEELRGQARDNLIPYIGNEYQLIFDEKASYTTIQEVKHGR